MVSMSNKILTIIAILLGIVLISLVGYIVYVTTREKPNVPTPTQSGGVDTQTSEISAKPTKTIDQTYNVTAGELIDINFSFPNNWDEDIRDRSTTMIDEYEVVLTPPRQGYEIRIIRTMPKPESIGQSPSRPISFLPYDTNDFETIATINGQELVVSKTGSTTTNIIEGRIPHVIAQDTFSPESIYYIYQKHDQGLTHYISALNAENDPKYEDKVQIFYKIMSDNPQNTWPKVKEELINIINTLEKK